jgi:hypothetical protein
MLVTNEIASITILITYQKGGDIINQIVPFKVLREQHHYLAIPLITTEESRIFGLSERLSFKFIENRLITEAETKEGDLNAIYKIASELKTLRIT